MIGSICAFILLVAIGIFYWQVFARPHQSLLGHYKEFIFDNVDQAILLFDCNDKILLYNDTAKSLFPELLSSKKMTMDAFLKKCGLAQDDKKMDAGYLFQTSIKVEECEIPIKINYKVLKDRVNRDIGKLFLLNKCVFETDSLTGFHDLEAFEVFVKDSNRQDKSEKMAVAVCDINGLSQLNASQGQRAGDKCIKQVAELLKFNFPQGSYFVRGRDANLMVVSPDLTECDVRRRLEKVNESTEADVVFGISVCPRTPDGIMQGLGNACHALHQKKLLDEKSLHSSVLASLIQALQECDGDTEAHVKRTQMMGAAVGLRLGLSDMEQSDLSLLCLLHDIGKIGIPLEILNKPGKLTAEEWTVMQSHVDKGFQIANSSPELRDIAKMVRFHHERWDGRGYPDGLSGEKIPFLSRIISVIDAYDAMVSNRVYKKAMTREAAFEELSRCAGTQFDPNVVREFIITLKEHPELGVSEFKETVSPEEAAKKAERDEILKNRGSVHIVNFMHYTLDADLNILEVNKTFEEVSGYTLEDVKTLHLNQADLIPEEDRPEYLCRVSEYTANNAVVYFEHRFVRKNGNIIFVLCMGRRYYEAAVREQRYEVIVIDTANTYVVKQILDIQRNRANHQLRYWESSFRKDSLTGLLNRASFQTDVERKLIEDKNKVMLFMMDVDNFRRYNDARGHHSGDEFLILFSQNLVSSLRAEDLSCRIGGDEFAAALMFKKDASDEFMYKRAKQIFDKMNMSLNAGENRTTFSMGAVIANEECNTFNKLYEASDQALRRSKESGRNKFTPT